MATYALEEHEYRYRPEGGEFIEWQTVTVKPIPLGNIAIAAGDVQVRVKASGTRPAGDILSSDQAYTVTEDTPPPPITGELTGETYTGTTLTAIY
jgi:hypothetical protein